MSAPLRFSLTPVAAFAVLVAVCGGSVPAAAQDARATPPPAPTGAASPAAPANRLTGIETNRTMIAAEAPTDIVVNGTPGSNCALVIEFGDGSRSNHVASESTPFPLKVAHTYPKMADLNVRVAGAAGGAVPACDGTLEAAIHISPAGSKIETITLVINGCPEGWSLVGQVSADKSFKCTPIPDASAPTNLIHCTDGMKYFARGGNVGCAHPIAAPAETVAQAKPPVTGRTIKKTFIGPQRGGPMPRHGLPAAKAGAKSAAKGDSTATAKPAPKKRGSKSTTGGEGQN